MNTSHSSLDPDF